MLLVIDTNEYILAFGPSKKAFPKTLLDTLLKRFPIHTLRIPRMILEEVKRNLSHELFREFIKFVSIITAIDEDFFVPFELGAKYESKGLKPDDAFIAAYTEWVGADV